LAIEKSLKLLLSEKFPSVSQTEVKIKKDAIKAHMIGARMEYVSDYW